MALTPEQQQKIIENVIAAKGRSGSTRSMFRELGRTFGPFGELLGMVADVFSGGRQPRQREIEDAIRLLTEQGFRVTPGGRAVPESDLPIPPPVQRPRRPTQAQPPPVSTRRPAAPPPVSTRRPAATSGRVRPAAEPWPAETTIETLPTRIRGAFEQMPQDIEGFSPWIETPESSNVYAIAFDSSQGLLYVQFNASAPVIGYKDMTSICSGVTYRCGIRPHAAGPIYSYGGAGRRITEEMFERFVNAESKGQFVWQNLRICGTQHGHRYPYTLTDVPEGQSIARKATRRGLRVRVVPTVGTGRRGGRRSTLPERLS